MYVGSSNWSELFLTLTSISLCSKTPMIVITSPWSSESTRCGMTSSWNGNPSRDERWRISLILALTSTHSREGSDAFIWSFHDFDFCVEWVERDFVMLSTRTGHHRNSILVIWTCHWYRKSASGSLKLGSCPDGQGPDLSFSKRKDRKWQLTSSLARSLDNYLIMNLHNYFLVSHARSWRLCMSVYTIYFTFALSVWIALWERDGRRRWP